MRTKAAVSLFGILLLGGCGEDSSSPGTPTPDDAGVVDAFTSPEAELVDCVGAYGCPGQQQCVGAECDACVCTDLAGPAWQAMLGTVVDLHSRDERNAVALLREDPWLVRLEATARDFEVEHIDVEVPLEFGTQVFEASDGALYVFRKPRDRFVFHRLTAGGAVEWSLEGDSVGAFGFAGFAETSSGRVLGGWFRDGAMTAVDFSSDGEVVALADYAEFGARFVASSVHDFIAISDSEFMFAADGEDNRRMSLATFRDGAGEGTYVGALARTGSISNVILEGDTVFLGHGSSNARNVYQLRLENYTRSLDLRWQHSDTVFVEAAVWREYHDRIYERAAVARVDQGLVFGTSIRDLVSGGRISYLRVFDEDGSVRGTIGGMGPVRQLVRAAPNAVFVVWSNSWQPEERTFVSYVELPPR